jgi:DNA-binding PadR family transcriptional regulator
LRAAVLAALVEQPSHGYQLAHNLFVRMGPAWEVEPKRIYEVLEGLEKEGLVTRVDEQSRRGRLRKVYAATPLAYAEHAKWMDQRQRLPLVRADIHARMAFSRVEDAQRLLSGLEEYEMDCMEALEQCSESEVRPAAWRGRVLNLMRVAMREQLQAEIRWIMRARQEILEFLADPR